MDAVDRMIDAITTAEEDERKKARATRDAQQSQEPTKLEDLDTSDLEKKLAYKNTGVQRPVSDLL